MQCILVERYTFFNLKQNCLFVFFFGTFEYYNRDIQTLVNDGVKKSCTSPKYKSSYALLKGRVLRRLQPQPGYVIQTQVACPTCEVQTAIPKFPRCYHLTNALVNAGCGILGGRWLEDGREKGGA